jgi:uridine kinase
VDPTSQQTFKQVASWLKSLEHRSPLILGIGGPGGCGKSTLSHWLLDHVEGSALLPLDDFRLPRAQRSQRGLFGSHPDGNDLPRLRACLHRARQGQRFNRPIFDLAAGAATTSAPIAPGRILICDGELASHADIRGEFDRLIVVEAHWRTQLDTRLTRDLKERQCSLEKAVTIFLQSNLRDYPTHATGATAAADFVLYRSRRHRFTLKKAPSPAVPA